MTVSTCTLGVSNSGGKILTHVDRARRTRDGMEGRPAGGLVRHRTGEDSRPESLGVYDGAIRQVASGKRLRTPDGKLLR